MQKEIKHTPLDWGHQGHFVFAKDGIPFITCEGDNMLYNAEFIVRACNSHYELLEALKLLLKETQPAYHDCLDNGEPECHFCIADKAIAKAEGK